MTTIFTIENGSNRIRHHLAEPDAVPATGTERFSREAEWVELAASWPMSRLLAIWNSLPDVAPVKRFTDRKTGIERIWSALQTEELSSMPQPEPGMEETPAISAVQQATAIATAPEAAQSHNVAPEPTRPAEDTTRSKKPPAAKEANSSRAGSKTAMVLELLKGPCGATSKELMSATGWQAHSVRGFLSGTLGKKMGLTIVSTRKENGERSYSIPV